MYNIKNPPAVSSRLVEPRQNHKMLQLFQLCILYKLTRKKSQISCKKSFLSINLKIIFISSDKFPNERSQGSAIPYHSLHKCIWSPSETFLNFGTALNSPLKKCIPGRPICDQEKLISSLLYYEKNVFPCKKHTILFMKCRLKLE